MGEEQEAVGLKNNVVSIEEAGPCKKKITIEIPQETIRSVTDEQYNSLRKEVIVPGFRKGRAPRRLLEKRFGKETMEQVKLKLLAEASDQAIKDNELDVLREPEIDFEKIEVPAEGPLKFEFEVEVSPEFDLPPLEGIPVKKVKLEVTDEQIKKEIEQLQKRFGVWTPRNEGQVELEDQIIADVILKVEGAEEEKLNDVEIYVRQNGFIAAIPVDRLDQLMVGAKIGDKRQVTVQVPKTYFKEEYRGKKVDIQLTIKDIKWLNPANLDEDFFKRVGVEDETELRERMRDILAGQLEKQARAEMTEQIYQYLLDNTNFDLPLDVVAEHSTTLLKRQYANLLMRGLRRDQIEQQMEQLRASSEEQAKQQVKIFFIMEKIAKELDIDVSEEEINGYIAQLAVQWGRRPERMREEMVRDGSLAQFRAQVREDKCIAKLLESAKIIEVEPEKKVKKAKKTAKKSTKKAAGGKKQSKKGKTATKSSSKK